MYKTKVIPIVIVAIFFCSLIRAEGVEKTPAPTSEKAEIIQEIKDEVDWNDGILEYIPELKIQKDKDGKDVYLYLVKGKQVNLENLDEKTLDTVLGQVHMQAAQLRVDTMCEQLDAARRPPAPPPRPPDVPRPPKR